MRWELVPVGTEDAGSLRAAPRAASALKLAADLDLHDRFGWLMRCDEVAFPNGGVAFRHMHQGPGIRVWVMAAMCSTWLSRRLPPRLRRCRLLSPEDTSIGAVPV